MTFTALIHYRKANRSNPWLPILAGYRGEVTDGLADDTFIYTGVCETKDECVNELISHLKARGLSGKLKIVS